MRALLAALMIAAAAPAWANMGSGCFAVTTHKIGQIPTGSTVKIAATSYENVDGDIVLKGDVILLDGVAFWGDQIHKVKKHRVYRDSLTVFECAG